MIIVTIKEFSILTGARNTSGAYVELPADKTPLLVTTFLLMVNLNLKQSDSMHHKTPRY